MNSETLCFDELLDFFFRKQLVLPIPLLFDATAQWELSEFLD